MALGSGTHIGPYEIVAPIGAGGMGEVYRAKDQKLKRDVALKVLPEGLWNDPDALARFEREALSVAAMSHPNILAIFDFGKHEGIAYAVMELLEGRTLRDVLGTGPLRQKEAVGYALQIARGLSAAHDKGLVHRDLKPENVFVSKDGHVKILDFGLAKKTDPVPEADGSGARTLSHHTEPGTVVGTVGYMSPEQVRGQVVDQRADIFSFGAILYEMLSGRRAFHGTTASDTMAAILRDEPPELAITTHGVPPALDNLVKHCLEKPPTRRARSAHDIAFALEEVGLGLEQSRQSGARAVIGPSGSRWIWIGAGCFAIVTLTLAWLSRQPRGYDATETGPRRIAVLPFENHGSPEDDYFADGITDEVRGKLTLLAGLEVIARGSSTPYKKTTKTPEQIARELRVRYLLTATVRWQKSPGVSRVQVTPELVDVTGSGAATSKWQHPFDAELTGVFQVQSEIAARVAGALGVALGAEEQARFGTRPTGDLAAYDAFLRGESVSDGLAAADPSIFRRAISYYEQAVALDPAFVRAWAQLARARASLYFNGAPTPALAQQAREAAERAVSLAPGRPEGYLALGDYQRNVVHEPKLALDEYAKAERLSPANADLLSTEAVIEESLARWDSAVTHLRQAERLDPRSVLTQRRLGVVFMRLRRYGEAREALDRGLQLSPANLSLIHYKAMTFLGEGNLTAARAVLKAAPSQVEPKRLLTYVAYYFDLAWLLEEDQREQLFQLTPRDFEGERSNWAICLMQANGTRGASTAPARRYAEEARKALEQQLRTSPDDAQRHVFLGLALAYLGRKQEAITRGVQGVSLQPVTKDAYSGAYLQHQLARIFILVEEPEKALDQLEPLLGMPYYLSSAWLRIDPNFDPLRSQPRFQKLVAR